MRRAHLLALFCLFVGATPLHSQWVQTSLDDVSVSCFAIGDSSIFAGTLGGGVFLSTNSGRSWTAVNSGLTNGYANAFAVSGGNVFVATDSGVFLSTNSGTSWTAVNSGLTNSSVTALAISSGDIFAGTSGDIFARISGSGVWRRALSDMPTSVERKAVALPPYFGLEQNYPNPFNPATIISYRLAEKTHVLLKIYDVQGREVKTLIDERQAEGNHSVRFNAAALPSGVYFYRLDAGSHHDTRKLLLLK